MKIKLKTPRRERLVNASPTNPSTGVYSQIQSLSQAGDWTYRVEGLNEAGEVIAADQGSFPVEPAAV